MSQTLSRGLVGGQALSYLSQSVLGCRSKFQSPGVGFRPSKFQSWINALRCLGVETVQGLGVLHEGLLPRCVCICKRAGHADRKKKTETESKPRQLVIVLKIVRERNFEFTLI